jgi:hypothetical protein
MQHILVVEIDDSQQMIIRESNNDFLEGTDCKINDFFIGLFYDKHLRVLFYLLQTSSHDHILRFRFGKRNIFYY